MRYFLILLVLGAFVHSADSAPPANPRPLDSLLQMDKLWEAADTQFTPPNASFSFHWASPGSTDALRTTLPGITLFDIPATSMVARFKDRKLAGMEVVFYDRSENGELSHTEFSALVKKCAKAISDFAKTAQVAAADVDPAAGSAKVEKKEWRTPQTKYVLEYGAPEESGVPFHAEFIRLEMTPGEKP